MFKKYHRFIYMASFQLLLIIFFLIFSMIEYGFNMMTISVLFILFIGVVLNVLLYFYFKKINMQTE
ncbi:hypothetical protein [Amphibacillus cookii]|uniref:hypothetical protein n=1 Tax=Amphibacillus cookii TaxID=767787 RepID=UPI0019561D7C|nr:hypothetical protein [Amphibacillus cookii]MBM7540327.1 asparagine N-glycosylation enzyme membrane subunit Stt3 [Amphibacillus cookii]